MTRIENKTFKFAHYFLIRRHFSISFLRKLEISKIIFQCNLFPWGFSRRVPPGGDQVDGLPPGPSNSGAAGS